MNQKEYLNKKGYLNVKLDHPNFHFFVNEIWDLLLERLY